GGLDLHQLGAVLFERGVVSVLVEGGPRVHRSFLRHGLADKLYVFIGARTVGGDDAPGPIAGAAVAHMAHAGHWRIVTSEFLQGDLFCEAYPSRIPAPGRED
ncbi:MAG TPA: dihydrofolate reductase family protein, partial [Bacillota bacterium]